MDKQAFIEKYAPMAIEQQQRYGIPASVTLAQAAYESGWGESDWARKDNNFFGIHATKGWINSGKPTAWHNDNGMVRSCVYESVDASFEHHSKFLKENQRYSACFKLDPTDHRGWAYGICRAGYAERPKDDPDRYAKTIETIIRENGLEKYDQMGLSPMKRVDHQVTQPWGEGQSRWSMPLDTVTGSLIMTSDIGHRETGISGASTEHNGLDLRAKYVPVLATEMNGRVIKAENDGNSKSGKHVIVEYERDGHKFTVSYCHLSKVDVKEGDTVGAGQTLGVSGNSSYRDYTKEKSLDPHLHLTVRRDGEIYDPKKYLAEIAVKGGLDTALVRKGGNGEDLLAQYKKDFTPDDPQQQSQDAQEARGDLARNDQQELSREEKLMEALKGLDDIINSDNPADWMSWLTKKGGDLGLGGSGDLIGDLVGSMLGLAITLPALLGEGGDELAEAGEKPVSAEITPEDQKAIDRTKAQGIDPKDAVLMTQTNAEAELTNLAQQETQQQQITVRG